MRITLISFRSHSFIFLDSPSLPPITDPYTDRTTSFLTTPASTTMAPAGALSDTILECAQSSIPEMALVPVLIRLGLLFAVPATGWATFRWCYSCTIEELEDQLQSTDSLIGENSRLYQNYLGQSAAGYMTTLEGLLLDVERVKTERRFQIASPAPIHSHFFFQCRMLSSRRSIYARLLKLKLDIEAHIQSSKEIRARHALLA
ncbi:hypothetical protein L218DRAFT_1076913 [Marasmius fiardii PR-910]|nr:hypothetical protein L218DRAFT_1076913 [Marasmius fiardii PR-910]